MRIAHFKGKYLNPSEGFIYDQINNIPSIVLCIQKDNSNNLYPFSPIYSLPLAEQIKFVVSNHPKYFEKITEKEKINLIHIHFGNFANKFINFKIPIITTFYGVDIAKPKGYYTKIFKHGNLIIALSKDMKSRLIELGCPAEKIKIWHIGIDIDNIKPKQNYTQKDSFTFSIISRFVEKKGIEYGIKAFAKVVKIYPTSKLRIWGNGYLFRKYTEIIKEYKIQDNVIFSNNPNKIYPQSSAFNELSQCDAFLLPSVSLSNDYGGTPLILLEASAHGLPVITTDDAGNSEEIIDYRTGFIVYQKNIKQLTDRMLQLIENPNLCKEFGKNGRAYVEQHFNKKIQLEKLTNIYEDVLNDYQTTNL